MVTSVPGERFTIAVGLPAQSVRARGTVTLISVSFDGGDRLAGHADASPGTCAIEHRLLRARRGGCGGRRRRPDGLVVRLRRAAPGDGDCGDEHGSGKVRDPHDAATVNPETMSFSGDGWPIGWSAGSGRRQLDQVDDRGSTESSARTMRLSYSAPPELPCVAADGNPSSSLTDSLTAVAVGASASVLAWRMASLASKSPTQSDRHQRDRRSRTLDADGLYELHSRLRTADHRSAPSRRGRAPSRRDRGHRRGGRARR